MLELEEMVMQVAPIALVTTIAGTIEIAIMIKSQYDLKEIIPVTAVTLLSYCLLELHPRLSKRLLLNNKIISEY